MRKTKRDLLAELFAEARKREIHGLKTYGAFDPKKDHRILASEAQEEVIDVLNYLRFFHRKYPDTTKDTLTARRLTFALYCALRELEVLELNLTAEKGGIT